MNISLTKSAIIAGRRINLSVVVRRMVWLAIVVVSIAYSVAGSRDNLLGLDTPFQRFVYYWLNFGSFVVGVLAGGIILFSKRKSWMAFAIAVMLVTFTATDNGLRFWYQLITGVSFSVDVANNSVASTPYIIALFFNVLYMALLTSSLVYVLLAFPEEKLPSRGPRWFFRLLLASQAASIFGIAVIFLLMIAGYLGTGLAYRLYALLDVLKSLLMIGLAAWQVIRLQKITDPVDRQKVMWIISSLVLMTIFYALGTLVLVVQDLAWVPVWAVLPGLLFTYAFVLTLFIAIRRYRFWDMTVIVNKALVYGAVTLILTVFGFVGASLLDVIAKSLLESDATWPGAFILLPVAGLFNPLRERMQAFVDHYLKPEEVDFSSALVEFSPDAQLMLSSQDMLRILVRQAVEQLNLSGAAIYLKAEEGQLVQREPAALDPELPPLRLDDRTRARLEKGNVVEPYQPSPFSLYIPLLVTRAAKHQFLGVLAFGRRNSGEGYPTPVLKSLKKLGCDAGKTIYIAQLREHLGRDIMARLSAIERGLSTLDRTA